MIEKLRGQLTNLYKLKWWKKIVMKESSIRNIKEVSEVEVGPTMSRSILTKNFNPPIENEALAPIKKRRRSLAYEKCSATTMKSMDTMLMSVDI